MLSALLLGSGFAGCDGSSDATAESSATGKADDPSSDLMPIAGRSPSCDADQLLSIPRPLGNDGADAPYWYQHLEQAGDDAPTIIFLPGGPGGSSIDGGPLLPDDANLIFTDPRGIGCNAGDAPYPSSFYSTEQFADDIIAVIAASKVDDYVLYGHSYGTVLATVVASKLGGTDLPQPHAVVLEGVFGAAIPSDEVEYQRLWTELWPELPIDVQIQLEGPELPLGRDAREWGELISLLLSQRSVTFLRELLSGLELGGDTAGLEGLFESIASAPRWGEDELQEALYTSVACGELVDAGWFEFELRNSGLQPTIDACVDQELDDPFDPADWPIDAPIIYVQGDEDPATAYEGARHHLDAQPRSDRTFVTVAGVGHLPLIWSISEECGLEIWDAVLYDGDVASSLELCGLDLHVEHLPPA